MSRRRIRRCPWLTAVAAAAALLVAPAGADPPAEPESVSALAALHVRGDPEAFARRAASSDPWLLACEARAWGHPDAALALAHASGSPDASALEAFLTRPGGAPADAWAALRAAHAAIAEGSRDHALERLRGLEGSADPVIASQVGLLQARVEDPEAARDAAARAATAARQVGWLRGEADALRARVRLLPAMPDLLLVREILTRLAEVQLALRDEAGLVRTRTDLGRLALDLNSPEEALEHLEEARRLAEARADRPATAIACARLAAAHLRRGEYALAQRRSEEARRIAEESGSRPALLDALEVTVDVLLAVGAPDEARAAAERALPLYVGDRRPEQAALLGNLAIACRDLGRYEEATLRLDAAAEVFRSVGDESGVLQTALHRATLEVLRKRPQEALTLAEGVARRAAGDPELAAMAAGAKAEALLALGRPDDALLACREALGRTKGKGWVELENALHDGVARSYFALGRPADALDSARRAVRLRTRTLAALPPLRMAAARQTNHEFYETGLRAALSVSPPDPAILAEFSEWGRAGSLQESLGGAGTLPEALLPPDLVRRELDARREVAAARHRLDAARAEGVRSEVRARASDLDRALSVHEAVLESIQRDAQRATGAALPQPASLEDLRAALESGTALVLYGWVEDQVSALVVTHDGPSRSVKLGRPGPIRRACAAALRTDLHERDHARVLERLADLVLAPLEIPPTITTLLVSPAGRLDTAPFPALAATLPRDGGPPLDVAMVPSGTTWLLLREDRERRGKRVLAVGDPLYRWPDQDRAVHVFAGGRPLPSLAYSREEVLAVTRESDERLVGAAATETAFRAALSREPRWHVVHLAGHGLLDRGPELSSVVLAPGDGNDGFLTVHEVFAQRAPADLVVLSACEVGRGFVGVEGLVGMTEAWLCAGAARVIASLWKVDDAATKELMVRFHERWSAGASAAEALRDAQAFVRAQPRWSHPRYWAGWVLWGLAE